MYHVLLLNIFYRMGGGTHAQHRPTKNIDDIIEHSLPFISEYLINNTNVGELFLLIRVLFIYDSPF